MLNARKIACSLLSFSVLFVVTTAHAEDAVSSASAKTYLLKDLRQTVSNSDKCSQHLSELQQLVTKPFVLNFAKDESVDGKHLVKDGSGQLDEHTHTTIKNSVDGNRVHRVGMGSFSVKGSKFDYVLEVSANLDNKEHHYLYPVIIAANDANCYYSAVVDPSDETVAAFKKSVESGAVSKGVDLHTN